MSGKTTLCQVYAIWKSILNPNQIISFVSTSRKESDLNNKILVDMVSNLPKWMTNMNNFRHYPTKNILFKNGSTIYTINETEAMQPGYNPITMMILDEFALFEYQQEFIERNIPVLTYNKGQLVIASTPCRQNDLFHKFVSGYGHMKVVKASLM